jgi:hypothetical protein
LPAERSCRRQILSSSLGLGALGLLTGCSSAALGAHETVRPGDDAAMLNSALSLEYQAIAAYEAVLARAPLTGPEAERAAQYQADHRRHAEALAASVASRKAMPVVRPTPDSYRFEPAALSRRDDALRFLLGIEQGLALAHLGAVPALTDRDLAKGTAGILAVESMHWATIREALGETPVPVPIIG